MDTLILNLRQQKIPKTIVRGIGVAAVLGFVAITTSYIQGMPILAKDLLAHNTAIAPLLKTDIRNLEQEIQDYNTEIRNKYRGGVVYDIDTGIKHIRLKKYIQGRPVNINVVEINQNINPNIKIKPQLASDKLAAKRSITTIAKKENSIVAINGTFFKPQTGVPLGTLMINGKMYTGPIYDRVAMGIFDGKDGTTFDMSRVQLDAKIKTHNTDIKIDNINQPRMLSTYVLAYTKEWGQYAPPSPKEGMQVAINSENKIVAASVSQLEIPENGYVIVGPKSKLSELAEKKKAVVEIKTIPDWENVTHIISGGPYLVKNGKTFIDIQEQKLLAIGGRNPRTAIGYTEDNKLILVAVDGRENYSIGLTLNELANFMLSLGCVNAMNLDGGGSTVMYVNGRIVNNPQYQGGIALSNALTVSNIKPEA